jgi:hypothetical protein
MMRVKSAAREKRLYGMLDLGLLLFDACLFAIMRARPASIPTTKQIQAPLLMLF